MEFEHFSGSNILMFDKNAIRISISTYNPLHTQGHTNIFNISCYDFCKGKKIDSTIQLSNIPMRAIKAWRTLSLNCCYIVTNLFMPCMAR